MHGSRKSILLFTSPMRKAELRFRPPIRLALRSKSRQGSRVLPYSVEMAGPCARNFSRGCSEIGRWRLPPPSILFGQALSESWQGKGCKSTKRTILWPAFPSTFGRPRRKSDTRTSRPRRSELFLILLQKRCPSPMSTETEICRKTILRAAGKTRKTSRFSPRVFFALKNRSFPLSFFVRNMLATQREPGWRHLSPRIWRAHLRRMLEERSRIFLEVCRWKSDKQQREGGQRLALLPSLETLEGSGYCSHCGGCCEIASGFPDFPSETALPLRWQHIFGDGLGKGHRFCAFLWEHNASGLSVCAVHPWRSNPCRAFEEDECAYFMMDLVKHPLFRPRDFSMACQRLSRLINRR